MLDNFIILAVVLIVTGVMIRIARFYGKESEDLDPSDRVYRVHGLFRLLPVFGFAFMYIGGLVIIIFDMESAKHFKNENLKEEAFSAVIMNIFFIFGWLYLNRTKVYFDGGYLVRTTMFGTKKIPIESIYEIVDRSSSANPIAAMTKVYALVCGKKKGLQIEAMIDGYETLIREIEHRAPQARYVKK